MYKQRRPKTEDIYSSAVIQALEQEYCSSCSAAVVSSACVSSHGLGARIMSRIYYGGRQAIYTATVGAMLANNMALPVYGATITVSSGVTSNNLSAGNGTEIRVYGSTISTAAAGGREVIFNGGVATHTTATNAGEQAVNSGGIANSTVLNNGRQGIYSGGLANNTVVNSGKQTIYSGGIASNTQLNSNGQIEIQTGGSAVNLSQGIFANIQLLIY